jgi:hypothetical protein
MGLLLVVDRSAVGWPFLEVRLYVSEGHFSSESLAVLLNRDGGIPSLRRGEEVVMSIEHMGIYKPARRRS